MGANEITLVFMMGSGAGTLLWVAWYFSKEY